MLRTQSNPLRGSAGGAGPVIRDSADLEKFWCARHLLCRTMHRQSRLSSALRARQHQKRCLLQHPVLENFSGQAASDMKKTAMCHKKRTPC